MVSTIKRRKKKNRKLTKSRKIRQTIRRLYRKKLTRLKTYLRREAFRVQYRKRSSLWAIARSHLRAHAGRYIAIRNGRPTRTRRGLRPRRSEIRRLRTRHLHNRRLLRNCRPLFRQVVRNKLIRRNVRHLLHIHCRPRAKNRSRWGKQICLLTPLPNQLPARTASPTVSATQRAKTKIRSALLRRKRYRYKKLTYRFLKASRLRWLRSSRLAKRKRAVRAKARRTSKKVKPVLTPLRPARLKATDKVIDVSARSVKGVKVTNKVKKSNTAVTVSKGSKKAAHPRTNSRSRKSPRARMRLLLRKPRLPVARWKLLQRIYQKPALTPTFSKLMRSPRRRYLLRRRALLLRRGRRSAPPARRLHRKLRPHKVRGLIGRKSRSRKLKGLVRRKTRKTGLRLRRYHLRLHRRAKLRLRRYRRRLHLGARLRSLKGLMRRKTRRAKLRLRRHHRRQYRRLRRKVNKRASARNRRSILIAASRPLRKHLYYKRLLLTRRVAVALQELRTLRPTLPHTAIVKEQKHVRKIERHWRPVLARTTHLEPLRYRVRTSKKKVVKGAVKKAIKVLTKKASKVHKVRRRRLLSQLKKSLNRLKLSFQNLSIRRKKQKLLPRFRSRKAHPIGPLTLAETEKIALAEDQSKNSVKSEIYAAQQRYRHISVQPFLKPVLYRKRPKSSILNKNLAAANAEQRRIKQRLHALRNRPATARKVHNLKRIIKLVHHNVNQFKQHLAEEHPRTEGQYKRLSVGHSPTTALRNLSVIDRHRIFTAHGLRTARGRHPLIRRFRLVGGFPRTHLYDPCPRIDFALGMKIDRKSRRYKRLEKRARVVVKKSKRQLRRRSRKKVVIVRKRQYLHSERSPVHAGRTVPWKKKGTHRSHLYRKLALTRAVFGKLLRAEQLLTNKAPIRLAPRPVQNQARMNQLSRALLWAVIQFTGGVPASKQSPAVARLRTTARLFLRRTDTLTAPIVRTLVLKTLALPTLTTAADSTRKNHLLTLERYWISTTYPGKIAAQPVKAISVARKAIRLRRRRTRTEIKLKRRLFAMSDKSVRKIARFNKVYTKKVKRLLPLRWFKAIISSLRPKRWHSKQRRARVRRQRATALYNWRTLRQYHLVRRFTIHRALSRLSIRIRRGESWAARYRHKRISTRRKRSIRKPVKKQQTVESRLRFVLWKQSRSPAEWHKVIRRHRSKRRRKLLSAPRVKRAFRKSLLRLPRARQQQLRNKQNRRLLHLLPLVTNTRTPITHRQLSTRLRARLDSARLRTRRSLLWKAPLQPLPAALFGHKLVTHWHGATVMQKKEQLKLTYRDLRHPLLSAPRQHFRLPLAVIPTRRWRAVRMTRRYSSLLSIQKIKHAAKVVVVKAFLLRRRLSRIGRAATTPKLRNAHVVRINNNKRRKRVTAIRARRYHQGYKKEQIKKELMKRKLIRGNKLKKEQLKTAREFRIRVLRRPLFLRKNRFFVRRRSTRGFRVKLEGKLLPPQGTRPYVKRPIRYTIRRSNPLRRSLRRRLAAVRRHQRKPARFRTSQSSTGRLLSKLLPLHSWRKRWVPKLTRKQSRVLVNKAQTVDQLLQRFEQLAAVRAITLPTIRKAAPKAAVTKKVRRFRLVRIGKKRLRLRVTKESRRYSRIRRAAKPIRRLLRAWRRITSLRQLRLRTTIRADLIRWRRRTFQLVGIVRIVKRPRRDFSVRKLNRIWPDLTRGKCRFLKRDSRARRRGRLVRLSKKMLLRYVEGEYEVDSVVKTARLPKAETRQGSSQRKSGRSKIYQKLQKKGGSFEKESTTKTKSGKVQTSTVKNQAPANSYSDKLNSSPQSAPSTERVPRRKFRTDVVPAQPLKSQKIPAQPATPPSSHRVNEPALSDLAAKKIALFNNEKSIHTKVAYDSIMSGLKAAWTRLSHGEQGFTAEQLERDVTVMEQLYTKHYGPVVRFESKALMNFVQYTAKQTAATPVSKQKSNKHGPVRKN